MVVFCERSQLYNDFNIKIYIKKTCAITSKVFVNCNKHVLTKHTYICSHKIQIS